MLSFAFLSSKRLILLRFLSIYIDDCFRVHITYFPVVQSFFPTPKCCTVWLIKNATILVSIIHWDWIGRFLSTFEVDNTPLICKKWDIVYILRIESKRQKWPFYTAWQFKNKGVNYKRILYYNFWVLVLGGLLDNGSECIFCLILDPSVIVAFFINHFVSLNVSNDVFWL